MHREIANWKVLHSKLAFDHKWFKVRQDKVELPHGVILDDYFVSLGGTISLVVPVTKEGKFVLVRQYKHAAGEILLEFPAGYVDEGESPEDAAKRELAEETGLASPNVSVLTKMTNNPTKEVCDIHVYLARDAVKTQQVELDDNEAIETIEVTKPELVALIKENQIKVSATITAAYLAFEQLGSIDHK